MIDRGFSQGPFHDSEEKYKTIFETIPASIVVVDKNGQIIDINPYHVAHVGKGYTTKEDYIGENIVVHPSVVGAGLSEAYKSVLEGKSIDREGVYFPSLTGKTDGYFNVRAVPLLKDGEVIGAIMIHEDITELKQAEVELRQAEDLSSTLLETASKASQGIAVIQDIDDSEAVYVFVNDEYARILGYERDELLGMFARDTVSPSMRDLQMDRYRRRQRGENVTPRYETEMLRNNGEVIPVEVGVSPTIYKGLRATVAYVNDISARKEQEAERLQLQGTLRSYASQVIKAHEEERGRLARDLHDDTIQELLFVSHRLQDIGSGAYGQLPQLVGERLEEVRAYVERTMGEVRSFTQEIRPFMLDDMGLVPTLRWLVERATVGVDGVHADVHVSGDRRRLSSDVELAVFRVVQESLNNIRKHAGASVVRVLLNFGEDKIEMVIEDDGRGFEVPALPTQFAGQGKLGLAGMSERILLLQGLLIIESQLGKGTTIRVEVPV